MDDNILLKVFKILEIFINILSYFAISFSFYFLHKSTLFHTNMVRLFKCLLIYYAASQIMRLIIALKEMEYDNVIGLLTMTPHAPPSCVKLIKNLWICRFSGHRKILSYSQWKGRYKSLWFYSNWLHCRSFCKCGDNHLRKTFGNEISRNLRKECLKFILCFVFVLSSLECPHHRFHYLQR